MNTLGNHDPLPLVTALLLLAALYALPGFGCWLAIRARRKGWALVVAEAFDRLTAEVLAARGFAAQAAR